MLFFATLSWHSLMYYNQVPGTEYIGTWVSRFFLFPLSSFVYLLFYLVSFAINLRWTSYHWMINRAKSVNTNVYRSRTKNQHELWVILYIRFWSCLGEHCMYVSDRVLATRRNGFYVKTTHTVPKSTRTHARKQTYTQAKHTCVGGATWRTTNAQQNPEKRSNGISYHTIRTSTYVLWYWCLVTTLTAIMPSERRRGHLRVAISTVSDPSGSGRVDMLTGPVAAARAAVATGAWV